MHNIMNTIKFLIKLNKSHNVTILITACHWINSTFNFMNFKGKTHRKGCFRYIHYIKFNTSWPLPIYSVILLLFLASYISGEAIVQWCMPEVVPCSLVLATFVAMVSTMWTNQRADFKSVCNLIRWHCSHSCKRMLQELGNMLYCQSCVNCLKIA